jgi:hypothetical protein
MKPTSASGVPCPHCGKILTGGLKTAKRSLNLHIKRRHPEVTRRLLIDKAAELIYDGWSNLKRKDNDLLALINRMPEAARMARDRVEDDLKAGRAGPPDPPTRKGLTQLVLECLCQVTSLDRSLEKGPRP